MMPFTIPLTMLTIMAPMNALSPELMEMPAPNRAMVRFAARPRSTALMIR